MRWGYLLGDGAAASAVGEEDDGPRDADGVDSDVAKESSILVGDDSLPEMRR